MIHVLYFHFKKRKIFEDEHYLTSLAGLKSYITAMSSRTELLIFSSSYTVGPFISAKWDFFGLTWALGTVF